MDETSHNAGGDTGHLKLFRQIMQLEDSIDARKRDHEAARSTLDAAKRAESDRRVALSVVDDQLRAIGTDVLRKRAAVYLNGEQPNRGRLELGNEVIRFSGWRGHVELPLPTIADVQIGTVVTAPRAGVPLLDKIWPGDPRPSNTLLLTIQPAGDGAPWTAIVADLPDAADWREQILAQRRRLAEVAARRADVQGRREQARAALATATAALQAAQKRLESIGQDLAELQSQLKRSEHEKRQSPNREIDAAVEEMIRTEHEALKRLAEG
ncbi:MAG TPA: hypothetical protein VMV16_02885 [Solirubrobacteraceae bacterium]|nr:hypothetical protein [Solirubrobacteraceae bacterium]HVC32533.1 hypothetical protein [Chloroflexota bacterium]